jgi:flagellar protein FlaG
MSDKSTEGFMQIGPISANIPLAPATTALPERTAQEREAAQNVVAAVKTLNQSQIAGTDREFSISIDPQSKRPVVQIVDSTTREIIDQIPSKYILDVAASLTDQNSSNLLSDGR